MTAPISIAFAVASTLISSVGLILFKKAARTQLTQTIRDKRFIAGAACFIAGGFLLIFAMQHSDLSEVFPLTSLTYIWVMILSKLRLGEAITKAKITGVALIVAGIILITLL